MQTKLLLISVFALTFSNHISGQKTESKKIKILVHITHGPENITRAALGFLMAESAHE